MKEETTHLASSANGAIHTSLGQRPGKPDTHIFRALKARSNPLFWKPISRSPIASPPWRENDGKYEV